MTDAIRSQGTKIQRGSTAAAIAKTISSITAVGNVATLTTSAAHGFNTGDSITIIGAVPAAYNGTFTLTVTGATTLTYIASSAPGGAATAMGTYTGAVTTYVDIEHVSDVKIGGISVSTIDTTHLQSKAKEFVAGLIDNGSLDASMNFVDGAVQGLIFDDLSDGITSPYRMVIGPTLQSPINIYFKAFPTKWDGPTAKVDGKMDLQVSWKITGALTWA